MGSSHRTSPTAPRMLTDRFAAVLAAITDAARQHYGERLVSLAVFGSVDRGTPRPDSDVDLPLVAEGLPHGRFARLSEFEPVEASAAAAMRPARGDAPAVQYSPVFKTPAEVTAGSPLFFDMIDDARLLYDRDEFLARALERLSERLARLGARRIWRGNAWFWDLKPDYRPGDIFEL